MHVASAGCVRRVFFLVFRGFGTQTTNQGVFTRRSLLRALRPHVDHLYLFLRQRFRHRVRHIGIAKLVFQENLNYIRTLKTYFSLFAMLINCIAIDPIIRSEIPPHDGHKRLFRIELLQLRVLGVEFVPVHFAAAFLLLAGGLFAHFEFALEVDLVFARGLCEGNALGLRTHQGVCWLVLLDEGKLRTETTFLYRV